MRAAAGRLVAIGLAVLTARAMYDFGQAVEPQISPLRQGIMAALAGIAGHVGLFLSADASTRPALFRRLVAVSMLPAAFTLGGAMVDTVQRLYRDNPLSTPVMLVYASGLAIYVLQLIALMRPAVRGSEPASAA